MRYEVQYEDPFVDCVVVVEGDFDLYSSPGFLAAMKALIRKGKKTIRVDLSGVEYLDASGVG